MLVSSYIFLPGYFQCNVTSIYEFLEMRFGKCTKYTVSALFIIQMVLYMSSVLYASVLALTAVTDVSTEIIITVCGLTCTFYCFMGGLKAVLWSDVFQGILMFVYIIIVYTFGITEVGGIGEVVRRAETGDRIKLFDTTFDLTTRYTFWNVLARGLSFGIGVYGTSQIEVQRALSMSKCQKAQSALRWSVIPVILLFVTCSLLGVILYAVFYMCDPVTVEPGLKKYDQLVPYFIVTRMHGIPGLIGLSFAGVFSGSLSTISSALNSLSTVTVVDFLEPLYPFDLSDSKLVFIAKGLSLFYGILCICICFLISKFQSVLQITLTFLSVVEGPTIAIFFIGVLTRKATDKIIMFGLVIGFAFSSWLGIGTILGGHKSEALPLDLAGCSNYTNITNFFENSTTECSATNSCTTLLTDDSSSPAFILYRISYLWIPLFAFLFTMCAVFATVLLTGWNKNVIASDSKCLAPVARYFMKKSSEIEILHLTENKTS
ncbi:Sodium-coupled monocarboxylate transporter 1 like protein [Argiope bruennichi]|uniref:Sodium-coupled monocarboxylate transporter 1 like protein n=1 Tax=Argiope bruennichi TaxID=94029 RepID=A0A8T0G3K6_ARGBR|nr:Sodium-coupled monocarboxylate transporter 1 like protein [Argiope bruennichi]